MWGGVKWFKGRNRADGGVAESTFLWRVRVRRGCKSDFLFKNEMLPFGGRGEPPPDWEGRNRRFFLFFFFFFFHPCVFDEKASFGNCR